MSSLLKEDQDFCSVRSGAWDLVPTLFHHHPDVLRQAENDPVRWSRRLLSVENQPKYGRPVENLGEWLFIREDLRAWLIGIDSLGNAVHKTS